MGKITYNRGTTFSITHIYQKNGAPSTDGQTLLFTAKTQESDSDDDDSTAFLVKSVAMSGSTNVITIEPDDILPSVSPGNYYYDIKVVEGANVVYLADSGKFILDATPTNRLA